MDVATGAGCGLRVAGCGLRAARCALRVARCRLRVAGVAGCALQVTRHVNAACIIYELQIYLSCALAVQTRCLRELRLLFVVTVA
jgi:hypothetical protein